MKRRFVLIAVAVILSGYVFAGCITERRGVAKTEALLRGDDTVQLAAFAVEYQQRRVHCSDPESLRYLERCIREHAPTTFDDRITYRVSLRFAGGGRLVVRTDWSSGGFSLCCPAIAYCKMGASHGPGSCFVPLAGVGSGNDRIPQRRPPSSAGKSAALGGRVVAHRSRWLSPQRLKAAPGTLVEPK